MIFRTIQIIFGLLLLGTVVYLGFLASSDSKFVIWFGLASALLAPGGIALISYAFTASSREILTELTKVTEIRRLIDEAKSHEEKIKLLEEEREKLVEAIEFETQKQALLSRKDSLENDAVNILSELDAIDKKISRLDASITSDSIKEEVKKLHQRLQSRQRGDIMLQIGSRDYSFDRDFLLAMPYGRFILNLFRHVESYQRKS